MRATTCRYRASWCAAAGARRHQSRLAKRGAGPGTGRVGRRPSSAPTTVRSPESASSCARRAVAPAASLLGRTGPQHLGGFLDRGELFLEKRIEAEQHRQGGPDKQSNLDVPARASIPTPARIPVESSDHEHCKWEKGDQGGPVEFTSTLKVRRTAPSSSRRLSTGITTSSRRSQLPLSKATMAGPEAKRASLCPVLGLSAKSASRRTPRKFSRPAGFATDRRRRSARSNFRSNCDRARSLAIAS